jgi:hypothetical protein
MRCSHSASCCEAFSFIWQLCISNSSSLFFKCVVSTL